MTSNSSPSVTFHLLTEENNRHTPQQLKKTADQRKACGGKRTTKGHLPSSTAHHLHLISNNKTPTACIDKRQSRQGDR